MVRTRLAERIQTIRLARAKAGSYIVQVSAWNLLQGPQDFALVVVGALKGDSLKLT